MTELPSDDYDSPWKEALEHYLPDFLALLFPQAHAGIDWSQGYEFLDKELQQVVRDAELGRRLADKLVRVVDTSGQEDWLLIHIEVQGDPHADLAERLFVYNYRIFDRHRRPVVSLAVLADERTDWHPDHFGWQRWGCEVGIRFPSVKLLDYRPRWAELETSANPFAVVVQAHLKTQETRRLPEERYRAKLALAKSLYRRGWGRDNILELFRFIDWMLRLPEELEERLWSEIQTYETVEHMPYVTSVERIGIRKGIQQGSSRDPAGHPAGIRGSSRDCSESACSCCARPANGSAPRSPSKAPRCSTASTTPRCWKTWPRHSSTPPTQPPGCRPLPKRRAEPHPARHAGLEPRNNAARSGAPLPQGRGTKSALPTRGETPVDSPL